MTIKRILLPFCDAAGFVLVVHSAFILGRLHKAQVRALFAQPIEGMPFIPSEGMNAETIMQLIDKAAKEKAEKLTQARETFDACSRQFADVEAEFTSIEGARWETLGSAARLVDITVLASGARYAADGWQALRDAAIFGSGRPILLVPPDGVDQSSFDQIVIAWKDSIEAARAIAAAHPFLHLAKVTHLVTIGESEQQTASLREAEQYLQLHHAYLRSEVIPAAAKNVGEVLRSKCEALGGALLVMGAYSHARWQEWMLGGVTEHVLREARTPVLMAH